MVKQIIILTLSISLYLPVFGQDLNHSPKVKYQETNPREKINSLNATHKSIRNFRMVSDDYQKLDSVIEYNFDEATNAWDKPFTRDSYSYERDGKMTSYLLSSWNEEQNQWAKLWKEDYNYNEQGKITDYTSYVYVDRQWTKEAKEEYNYNTKNKITEVIRYYWQEQYEEWLLTKRWAYSYDDTGKALKDSLYWWNDDSQQWMLKEKVDYEYIRDKPHYVIRSNWDNEMWKLKEKKWFLYTNITWELVSISGYKWLDEDWELLTREYYRFDEEENMNFYSIVSRNIGETWSKLLRERFTYDYDINYEGLILPYFSGGYDFFEFHHKLVNKKLLAYNFDTMEDEQYREVKYYYSLNNVISSAENDVYGTERTKIYPNPAMERITIIDPINNRAGLFELYDLNGSIVLTTTFANEKSLDVSSIPSGVYTYRVIRDKKAETGKLIIR